MVDNFTGKIESKKVLQVQVKLCTVDYISMEYWLLTGLSLYLPPLWPPVLGTFPTFIVIISIYTLEILTFASSSQN